MIERLIFTALSNGIAQLVSEPRRLTQFFMDMHDVDKTEAEAIKTYFLSKPPTIIHNYPRTETSKFPLFAIVLGDEGQSQKFMSDEGGLVELDEAEALGNMGLAGADILTSLYRYEYHILVITEGPDTTIYYYQLAKYFLTRQLSFFKRHGLLDTALSGADMRPDPHYIPAHLFVRRLTMTCVAEQAVIGDLPGEGRIRSVDGIFVAGGSESDNGGVRTLVTVPDEEA